MFKFSQYRQIFIIGVLFVFISNLGCSRQSAWNVELPSSREILSQSLSFARGESGYKIARSSLHLHSPISYDACKGVSQEQCLLDLRSALCDNHIDFAALTDHPDNMVNFEFSSLLLQSEGDQPVVVDGKVIGNQMICSDSHPVLITGGFENQLMAIGMTQHLELDASSRTDLYTQRTPQVISRLRQEADAIVFMPHTETRGKSTSLLADLHLDGIEIYNLHANVSPVIRKDDLGLNPFQGLFDLVVYWLDPFGHQQPDLAFLSFLQVSEVYARKWDVLIGQGQHIAGIAGNDAHQSFFPGKAKDGYQLDSFRRLTRWISNFMLVKDLTIPEIKDAIRSGRGWVVFEALGTPVDFAFFADTPTQAIQMGEAVPFVNHSITLNVRAPHLHANSPRGKASPSITFKVIRVNPEGSETVVASSSGSSLQYEVSLPGAYRVEVMIRPMHFKEFVGYQKELTDTEFKWMISNHIYILPSSS